VDLHAELFEARLHGLALAISERLERIGQQVEYVFGDHLEEAREVRRVVAVDVDVEVDGLEHLHQHERLRHRRDHHQRGQRRDSSADGRLRSFESRVESGHQQVHRSQQQLATSQSHGRVSEFLQTEAFGEAG